MARREWRVLVAERRVEARPCDPRRPAGSMRCVVARRLAGDHWPVALAVTGIPRPGGVLLVQHRGQTSS